MNTFKRILLTTLAFALVLTPLVTIPADHVAALSGSDFMAGRIIDDSVFFNSNMLGSSPDQTANVIQNFLGAKIPVCDTNGTQSSGRWNSSAGRYYTRAEYGAMNGYPAPYTCLKDFHQDITSTSSDNYCRAISAAPNQSAAQIIATVSQACAINPEVLIVLLQKEQGLVTDDWPADLKYRSATGFGCPDSGSCNQNYYGFYNQVYNAARQFQRYAKQSTSYNYRNNNTSYIAYNPTASCGGGNVSIQTQATAGLYNYTPYQPNPAALSNVQANGDSCSAYGNRNFWVYFNNWFGSPTLAGNSSGQANVQHRIKTISTSTQTYVFYYDSFQQIIRVAIQNIAAGTWTYSVLDGSSTTGGGRIDGSMGNSLDAIVYGNYVQVYYYDRTHGNLRHAWTDADGWHFENLDGASDGVSHYDADVGINPSVTLYNGAIQLYYYDQTYGNLRHAWIADDGWHFENFDGDGGSVSHTDGDMGYSPVVTVFRSTIQVYYYDGTRGNLRHAWNDAGGWHFENLDGDGGAIAHWNADVGLMPAVTIFRSTLQLYYYDQTYGNLRHAWNDDNGWHFENLDGTGGGISHFESDTGTNVSLTVFGNSLQLYYYDKSYGNLRHAWNDDNGWHFENLDGDYGAIGHENGDIGMNVGAITAGNGTLHVFYFNRTNGTLKHAQVKNTGWDFENLVPSVVY